MLKAWIFYILWLALTLLLNIFASSQNALIMLFLSVVIPLSATIIHRFYKPKINIHIILPDSVEKNCTAIGELKLVNKKKLPCPLVSYAVTGRNLLTGEKTIFKGKCSLPPKGISVNSLKIKDSYCGKIVFSPESVKAFDIFGLTYKKITPQIKGDINVLPEIFPVDINKNYAFLTASDIPVFSTQKPGTDLSEPFEYREYIIGDSPKSVHWKLSQKLDKLIIKQGGAPPLNDSVLVILDTRINENDNKINHKKLSRAVELFISTSKALCDMNIAHNICFFDYINHELFRYIVKTNEDWFDIIPKILSVQFCENDKNFFDDYSEYTDKNDVHIICVSPSGEKPPQFKTENLTILTPDEK